MAGTMVRVVLCALLLLASREAAGRNDGAKSSEETQTDAETSEISCLESCGTNLLDETKPLSQGCAL